MSKKKTKFCQDCGSKLKSENKFCGDCGYKLIIEEAIEDKSGHIKKVQEIVESESPIEIPKKLTLMPGERLLERHIDFYVSNKRLIQHNCSLLGSNTKDYHYKHVKGMQQDIERPFLKAGLIIGIIGLFLGLVSAVFFIIGAIFIILAFWFKKESLIILHMDGDHIKIPAIKSETGQRLANVLRTQLYD